ncbi:MAG: class F sortase [Nocardioidaceae bacterium]
MVELPSGTRVPIDETATGSDGTLAIPPDIDRAGWWDGSSRLGDPFGSIVVAAHVDSFTQGLGRFVELLDMHHGDVVTLRSTSASQRFRVTSANLVPRSRVTNRSTIYSVSGQTRLVLLTCGGNYDPSSGYADNMVVVARRLGRLQPLPR